ncbi:MAG: hypothetical protein ACLU8W_10980 [Clostridia bacterium]
MLDCCREEYGYLKVRLYDRVPLLDTYFENIGEAQTDENGQARIDIDPLFAETVNTSYPYQVYIQPYCEGKFYVAERTSDHFIVKGVPNGAFGYEIKAKQRRYETMRLSNI